MSDPLWPSELQHTRLSCLSLSLSLLKLMSSESVMLSNHFILCLPLLLLPSIFSSDLALHVEWPKYWSFSFSPSNEYSGLISFRIDWFDLCAVQETLKNILQHHSWKASILQRSAFFVVPLSHLYMTAVKTIAFTIWTCVSKVYSILWILNLQYTLNFKSTVYSEYWPCIYDWIQF